MKDSGFLDCKEIITEKFDRQWLHPLAESPHWIYSLFMAY